MWRCGDVAGLGLHHKFRPLWGLDADAAIYHYQRHDRNRPFANVSVGNRHLEEPT